MSKASIDLACELAGVRMHNPLVLASGVLGTSAALLERVGKCGAGAVTAKSCGPEARAGHPNPIAVEWAGGVINAVGLTNPGLEAEIPTMIEARERLHAQGIPLIASIFAPTVEDFGRMTAGINEAEPDLIEVNISCPNVGDEFGTPFSGSVESAAAVTRMVRAKTKLPIAIKLAPNVPNIARIALAAQEEGADAITAINTVPGMLIDPYAGRPVLSNKVGGVSGWSIKPIALRCVAEISRTVSIPVIGLGGVSNGLDAVEMIMAGATAVGVGSAVWQRGVEVFAVIAEEMCEFMAGEGYPDLASMRGIAIR